MMGATVYTSDHFKNINMENVSKKIGSSGKGMWWEGGTRTSTSSMWTQQA